MITHYLAYVGLLFLPQLQHIRCCYFYKLTKLVAMGRERQSTEDRGDLLCPHPAPHPSTGRALSPSPVLLEDFHFRRERGFLVAFLPSIHGFVYLALPARAV